jgi:hypothetical protein
MTTGQRKSTKKLLDQYSELVSKNEGQGSDRRIHVIKKKAAVDQEYSKDLMLGWEDELGWDDEPSFESFSSGTAENDYSQDAENDYSRDVLLAYRTLSMSEAPMAPSDFIYDAIPEADLIDAPSTKNPMDGLLRNCFLQAAKTNQITKQLRLGMPSKGSRIYAECMKPCRPVGSSIDVKLSSFVCLKTFFEHLEAQGLLKLKYAAPDPVVATFCWDHPDILNFPAWPAAKTVVGGPDESAASIRSRMGASDDAAASGKWKPSHTRRNATSMSQKDGAYASDAPKDHSSQATVLDAIRRVPSPSKARARRQQQHLLQQKQ